LERKRDSIKRKTVAVAMLVSSDVLRLTKVKKEPAFAKALARQAEEEK
jgi:hypothetical protein